VTSKQRVNRWSPLARHGVHLVLANPYPGEREEWYPNDCHSLIDARDHDEIVGALRAEIERLTELLDRKSSVAYEDAQDRVAAETGAKRGYVGEAPLSYVVLDEIRARCAQHRVSVKEGWTIDNQYTLDRDYLLGLIPPEWTDRPDCPHKTDARKDAPADPDCTWCQSAVKTSAPPEDPHDGLIVELNP
jgi:hypothetical protein